MHLAERLRFWPIVHRQRLQVIVPLGGLIIALFAACGGGGGVSAVSRDSSYERSACVDNSTCRNSYCNGTWPEGGRCKVDTDCPGYVALAGGYSPPAPNKRCIKNVCNQVGFCSQDHS